MPGIASTPEIDALVAAHAPVAIGVSGGKDSQAAALATIAHLDRIGHAGPRILIHSDLGSVEWHESMPTCERLATHLGVELVVVRRSAGDLMQRWERRWELSAKRYANLETVTLVPCWSTPDMRFCTSELKTHVILAELKRRFKGQVIINVTGVRREESRARAKGSIASPDKDGRIWSWRPISDWLTKDVFAYVEACGLAVHVAYSQFGMSRVSCRFCIMSSLPDLTAAAAVEEAHDIYRRMVDLEIASTFAFQGARWLGDIAPLLLTDKSRIDFADAKRRAAARIALEREITPGMLYVKGWPTRMLTDAEAAILASVRTEVCRLMGLPGEHLDVSSIHARYAELMAQNELRKAA